MQLRATAALLLLNEGDQAALLSDDKAAVDAFMQGRRLGAGSAAGSKNYIIDRVGEIIDAGVDEIMFGGILSDQPDEFVRFEEEVIAAFD